MKFYVFRFMVSGGLLVVFLATFCSCLQMNYFSVPEHCTGRAVTKAVIYDTSPYPSHAISCASACLKSIQCVSFIFKGRNCKLASKKLAEDCSNSEIISSGTYYEKHTPCRNNGYKIDDMCVCVNGYIGDTCERLMIDCKEGASYPYYRNLEKTVVRIHPSEAPTSFPVMCWFTEKGRTYIQHRSNGYLNFTRNWADYEGGFGDVSGDYWLGLQNIYYLTKSQRLGMAYESFNKNNDYIQEYIYRFAIGDGRTNYSVQNVQYENGNLGMCMTDALGRAFSTVDVDNDGDPSVRCADRHMSGWWFGPLRCTDCNPNGPITSPASGVRNFVDDEVFWEDDNHGAYQVYMWLK